MKHKMLQRMLTVGTLAISSLVMTAAAHATTVTYDFTANVTSGNSAFFGKTVSGSFSYDDQTGGSTYNLKVNAITDLENKLSLREVSPNGHVTMQSQYSGQFSAGNGANFKNSKGQDVGSFWSDLQLTNQTTSSLALGNGAVGTLQVGGGVNVGFPDWYKDFGTITANLTSLTPHGGGHHPASTPELDPRSGAGALGLLLGGLGMVFARRRSSK